MAVLPATIISDVKLPGLAGRHDVLIEGGIVSNVTSHQSGLPPREGSLMIDGGGDLAVPSFIDGHMHFDKTFLGVEWVPHSGTDDVPTRIKEEKRLRREHRGSLRHRARTLADTVLRFGTTGVRTHVDVDEETRLAGIEAILEVREERSGFLDMQVVAFPQSGLFGRSEVIADLIAAAQLGVDVIGGLDPTLVDGDASRSLSVTFGLAERFGKAIDIHLHEPGQIGADAIVKICERTTALGMHGNVVISHAYCLADVDEGQLNRLAAALREAGVAIMTGASGAGSLIPFENLISSGVKVFAASDNVRDAWAPFGNGDMLDRARMLAYRADFRTDEKLQLAFDAATSFPAGILGFHERGPQVGKQADIVLLPSPSIAQAVCEAPAERRVVRKGVLVTQRDGQTSVPPAHFQVGLSA